MNKNKTLPLLIFLLIFSIVIWLPDNRAQAGIQSFQNAVSTAMQTEFPAARTQEIGAAFADTFAFQWQSDINANVHPNTAAGRREFAAGKVAEYVREVRMNYLRRVAANAVAEPTPLP